MRSAALVLLAAALLSCSMTPSPASSSSNQPAQASDLRTQLALLLTEHVMIVAKESAAALNSSPTYGAYAALLSTNESALARLVGRAVGSTTAEAFARAWSAVNSDLVDYAIHVATHDGGKADADTLDLTDATMPGLAQQLGNITLGEPQPLLVTVTAEVTAIRDAIDGAANHQYAAMYTSLGNAIAVATTLGDALTTGIVHRFTDRFPGDARSQVAERRAHLNVLLQERAYLLTMATDAQLNNRSDERAQALRSLAANLDFIAAQATDPRLRQLLAGELTTVQAYATGGDAASRQALSDTFASKLAAISKAPSNVVWDQVSATIKVIDDQRAKNVDDIAKDDRAAATAMQPIADAL